MKPTIIAATLLLLGGCVAPDGRVDYARTALLGAGVGAGTFMLGGAIRGDQPPYGYGYGGGYGAGYGYVQHQPFYDYAPPPQPPPPYGYALRQYPLPHYGQPSPYSWAW